jgi:hypothetical protein
MSQSFVHRVIHRFGFYFCAFAFAGAVWQTEHYLLSGPIIYLPVPAQAQAVDAFSDMNRLLITLGTSLLGAMGLLLFGGIKGRACSRELWAAMAGALSVAVSIYYGYLANLNVMSMVVDGYFDPRNPALQRIHGLHFGFFLLGVIFFAGFIYQNVRAEYDHEKSRYVTGS